MQNINDRIAIILKESGKTKTAFAKSLKVSQQYISKLTKTGNPSDILIEDICQKYGYNEEWMRNGTQPKKIFDKVTAYLGQIDKGNDEFIKDLIVAYMELDDDSKKALQILTEKMYQNRKERGQ